MNQHPLTKQIWEFNSYKGFRPQTSFWHLLPPLYSQSALSACTRHQVSQKAYNMMDQFPSTDQYMRRSIQARLQRTLFNSSSFHSTPYRNPVCSWKRSWYAKYVLIVDWRNKWAGRKVDKNVRKWNREQNSNPHRMSLRMLHLPWFWPDHLQNRELYPCIYWCWYFITLHQTVILFPIDFVICCWRLWN